MLRLAWLCAILVQVFGLNFDITNVKRISLEQNNTYFGYKVHLQRGMKPMVIVGVPRADLENGGTLYSCSLDGRCTMYAVTSTNSYSSITTTTGNFLGSSLDGSDISGEEITVCSFRAVVLTSIAEKPTQTGLCFTYKNSTVANVLLKHRLLNDGNFSSTNDKGDSYYDYGYAQAGFDIHFMKEQNQYILGAPGVKAWRGSAVIQYDMWNKHYTLLDDTHPNEIEENGYLGYSVTSGRFDGLIQTVLGGPRANNYLGSVRVFNNKNSTKILTGEAFGAYFGAAVLAVDVDNDGEDELFVGAPFGSGSSYDEGYVYVYGKGFQKHSVLFGSEKPAARFGSAIVSLGDIDYDLYKDVAISAPYEDDGVGAVYIYMGGISGIGSKFQQRLSPLLFNGGLNARGFGMGLSRGNDVDENGYNDLAVGAYRSGEVFLFYGLPVIERNLTINANMSSISGEFMKITYCLFFTQNRKVKKQNYVSFKTILKLDDRTKGQIMFIENTTVSANNRSCRSLDVTISEYQVTIPYRLSLKTEILSSVAAKGNDSIEKLIPYDHGCGDDNICQTNITLNLIPETQSFVIGKDKEVSINVNAINVGEPGHQCQLIISRPEEITLSDYELCDFQKETYRCNFTTKLNTSKQVAYKFDVSQISPETKETNVSFQIECLGFNLVNGSAGATIQVSFRNHPYIERESDPERYFIQTNQINDFEISHWFSVGNKGPSPIKLDLHILFPIIKYEDQDVFKFIKVSSNNSECFQIKDGEELQRTFDTKTVVKEPLNETVIYDSFSQDIRYRELSCPGDYLYKSSQIARYEVKFNVSSQLLFSMYKMGVLKKHVIAFITSAFLFSSTQRIEGHAVTLIHSTPKVSTMLWIYIIVGVIIGFILLGLLVYLLHRYHFFDRRVREKMMEELEDEQNEANVTNPDNEDDITVHSDLDDLCDGEIQDQTGDIGQSQDINVLESEGKQEI